jgi:hypothetical protein
VLHDERIGVHHREGLAVFIAPAAKKQALGSQLGRDCCYILFSVRSETGLYAAAGLLLLESHFATSHLFRFSPNLGDCSHQAIVILLA